MTTLRHLLAPALALAATIFSQPLSAAEPEAAVPDTFLIPERALVLTGHEAGSRAHDLVAVLYDSNDLHFQDPGAPRFLFLDREGRAALGIGGYVKGTLQYDFDGAVDQGANFVTYDIPVPMNPAQRNQFFANANTSTLFLQLVGRSERFGYYQVYVQTDFTGHGDDYGLVMKQAWMSVGALKAGLTWSTFQDLSAGLATIDFQGPAGAINRKNIMFRYAPRFSQKFRGAIAIEMPPTSFTTVDGQSEAIKQRVPDIPAYIQYDYANGSHLRFSAIWRNLSYRNLATGRNHFTTGYGIQLSGTSRIGDHFRVNYQGVYGKGIASYFNDLAGNGFDLIPSSSAEGKLHAPNVLGVVGGIRYDINKKLFITGGYSQMRLYDQGNLGGDTYRYGQYVVANCFWTVFPELTLGLEYLHGTRTDIDHRSGHANRLEAMLQYSF